MKLAPAGAESRRGRGEAPGLTAAEAASRLALHGPNRLGEQRGPPYARIALRQLADPLVALLIAVVVVSIGLGEIVEAAAVAAIVVLNAALGFGQEAAAERAVRALRDAFRQRARVLRDGAVVEIDAEEVVPGDVLVLESGDRVAADAALDAAHGLEVDESALTGESVPVAKIARDGDGVGDGPLAERPGDVFAGTAITRGRARAVVTATGDATEIGRVATLTASARPPRTPLQEHMGRLSTALLFAGVGVTVLLTLATVAQGEPLREAFLIGASVAVAAVPEGLAATVTIALALGARDMAARGAIVRRLAAVETIGSATAICTDKTGTLTQNRLRLARAQPAAGVTRERLLEAALLASAATGEHAGADPLERALRDAAGAPPAPRPLLGEIPFDAERRRMTVIYAEDDGVAAYAKGAPEALLPWCAGDRGSLRLVEKLAQRWAEDGLRVLLVAERRLDEGEPLTAESVERELVPTGLVAFEDPLRPAAGAAVQAALGAGVSVRMLTGDHPATARAIGRELGLREELVHARVTPADKLTLVQGLQESGEVVAVTGDGVNDAPALRAADVGVAMGLSGTEAAREAADLVLTDDDFATIVAAMREGRRIADNVRTVTAFLLSANLGEVVLFAFAVVAGLGAPMTVVQVLLVNFLTDGLPALALTRDPAAEETMTRPPRRAEALFGPRLATALGLAGVMVGVAAAAAYLIGREVEPGAAQTMAFATIALSELVFVFSLRSSVTPAWRGPRNPGLAGAAVVSAGLVLLCIYLPAAQAVLDTRALAWPELAAVAGLSLVPAAAVELGKALRRRRS